MSLDNQALTAIICPRSLTHQLEQSSVSDFQPTIGIVIPTYNRRVNLQLCLSVLHMQTKQDFVVVVADDGSTDDTRLFISETIKGNEFWQERLIYVNGGPQRGVRTGRARNIGTAALPPSVKLLIQLDTDILLVHTALESFWKWYERHPDAVILAQIDWLPRMDESTIREILLTEGFGGLSARVPDEIAQRVDGTYVGRELRIAHGLLYTSDPQPEPLRAEWYLPGAMGLPLDLYWSLGGSDEMMRGYGFQDSDFGTRLVHAGVQCLAIWEIWAGHVWHPSGSEGHLITAQRNVDYLIRKYQRMGLPDDSINFYHIRCDWAHWWHYNRERGTTLVRVGEGESAEIWAINQARTHRLQVPDESWVRALGFSERDITPASVDALEGYTSVGVAYDPLGDGLDYLPPPRGSLE